MIDGLKLTMTGEELRKRLDERVKDHERRAAWYKREAKRDPDPNDEEDFGLPEHTCEFEEEFHDWRAKALAYIREYVDGGEVYRLDERDVAFGELLPENPSEIGRPKWRGSVPGRTAAARIEALGRPSRRTPAPRRPAKARSK